MLYPVLAFAFTHYASYRNCGFCSFSCHLTVNAGKQLTFSTVC